MRLFYLLCLGVIVAIFLWLRSWIDAQQEKALDIEVVRDGEEHLGNWANKSKEALIYFRLHRDARFTWKMVSYPEGDTVTTKGTYDIIGPGFGRSPDYYPRLIAFDEKRDTLFQFFVAYITPYDTKVEKVDRMVLRPNSIYDTVSYTFFRVKP